MREGLSHRIVAFVANLLPIYTHALIDDRHCARSLIDGTLILPLEEQVSDALRMFRKYFYTFHDEFRLQPFSKRLPRRKPVSKILPFLIRPSPPEIPR